ncbi:hypothetical protein PYCC9005_003207 [Savitreella phatthalungensis]
MRNQWNVATVPAADASSLPALVLSFDDRKYLFNCGEGTQRQLLSQGIAMRKIQNIFMSWGWDSHSGLPGLLLSLHDANGLPPISLHGPQGLVQYLVSLRAGQQRAWRYSSPAPFDVVEYGDDPQVYEDGNIRVLPRRATPDHDRRATPPQDRNLYNIATSVWTGRFLQEDAESGQWRPYLKRKRETECVPLEEADDGEPSLLQKRAFGKYMQGTEVPRVQQRKAAISYWVQARELPGKFDVAKAKALGVMKGPLYGELQRGKDVTLPSGQIVTPGHVMGKPRKSAPLILLHCPSVEYISSLIREDHVWPVNDLKTSTIVIHCCPDSVMQDVRYSSWARSLGDHHLSASPDHVPDEVVNVKAANLLGDLAHLLPGVVERLTPDTKPRVTPEWMTGCLIRGQLLSTWPELKIQRAPPLIDTRGETYRRLLEEHRTELILPSEAPSLSVCTLGTGSAGPSSYRNVAATLVRASDGTGFLLDCGEATIGQMRRLLGDDYELVLRQLRLVFISHMHADHHLGLVGLIREWLRNNQYNEARLVICCPLKLARAVGEYTVLDDEALLSRIDFSYSSNLTEANNLTAQYAAAANLRQISAVATPHSEGALCVRFDLVDGTSFAYSGDTRPLPEFAALAKGVTLLIHEATLEDAKLDEAVKKRHSTLAEAMAIAIQAGAQTTVLTHISQRYPKFPIVSPLQAETMAKASMVVAHDGLCLKTSDIPKYASIMPTLQRFWTAVDKLQQSGALEKEEEEVVEPQET